MRYAGSLGVLGLAVASLVCGAVAYDAEESLYARYALSEPEDINDFIEAAIFARYAIADAEAEASFDNILLYARNKGKPPPPPPGPPKKKEAYTKLPPPIQIKWEKGLEQKKKKALEDKKEAERRTKQALVFENRWNPPKSPSTGKNLRWNEATIKHGFKSDSSKRTGTSRPVDTAPHVHATATASNGYNKKMHIGQNGKVRT